MAKAEVKPVEAEKPAPVAAKPDVYVLYCATIDIVIHGAIVIDAHQSASHKSISFADLTL